VSGAHFVGGCHVSVLATLYTPRTFSTVEAQMAHANNTVTLLDEFLFKQGVTSSSGHLQQEMQEDPNIAYVQSGTDEEVRGTLLISTLFCCISLSLPNASAFLSLSS
jgi:hypothetical protein